MKIFSKAMAFLCGLTLVASTVPIISVGAVEDVTQAETNDATSQTSKKAEKGQKSTEKSAEKNVKIGKVMAVNGNVITVSLGEFTSQSSDSVDSDAATANGTRSKKQKRSAKDVTVGTENQTAQKRGFQKSTNVDSGENTCEQPQKRGGKSGRTGTFTENGTTLDVAITDSVTFEKKGEAIAVSDVTEGDLLKLVYDENGNLIKVKFIKNKGGHGKGTKAADSQKITGQTAES